MNTKWRFAIGTTSRVPYKQGYHYLIADYDSKFPSFHLLDISGANNAVFQKTEHGWHLYTDWIFTFDELVSELHCLGADEAWIRIGKKRGYFFLADKSHVAMSWPVERMVIYHGENETETRHTRLAR